MYIYKQLLHVRLEKITINILRFWFYKFKSRTIFKYRGVTTEMKQWKIKMYGTLKQKFKATQKTYEFNDSNKSVKKTDILLKGKRKMALRYSGNYKADVVIPLNHQ